MKILIIGGVAGGASAAARLRRLDEQAEIIIFEKGEHISFANCGLPYYISDVIDDREELLLQTPESFHNRFNVDVRVNSEVIKIDPSTKSVTINHNGNVYEESYEKLVIAVGAKPFIPNIDGTNDEGVFTLRNVNDSDRIKAYIKDKRQVVVVGGGFIGIEMAENLVQLGKKVTLVEASPQVLPPYDRDIIQIVHNELRNRLRLVLNDGIISIKKKTDVLTVQLKSGDTIDTDAVIMAIGVVPDTIFISSSGIELGARGHIKVNSYLQTNIEDIYAVGDAIEVVDEINGNAATIPLAGPANKQGRIVANNICGYREEYRGSLGSSVIKVFDYTAACTGNNEGILNALGIDHKTIFIWPNDYASYYPNSTTLALKLHYGNDGKILGAQAIGLSGVEKRIDVIATAIKLKASVYDLADLELCYAPPYSSAKSPENMIGFIARNNRDGLVTNIMPKDLDADHKIVLDIRTDDEFSAGHIAGSIQIPVDELRDRLDELDRSKVIQVVCRVGVRGNIACRILKQNGFRCENLSGGYLLYSLTNGLK